MRTSLLMLGILLILAGGIFYLQGVNILPGSFMTGRLEWAIYGAIAFVAGVLITFGARRRN
ncbi:MAG TPA: hypothetical protein VGJ22_05110 [Anaerolineales bacterium]